MNRNKPADLYLGYDANCSKCSTIATRVESEVGDELSLLPLSSLPMRRWREKLLEEDARWMPTLVRISGDQENAYLGWQIGPPLAAALGAKKSLKVLSALGSDQLTESRQGEGALQAPISRKMFFRASAVVVGMAALMGRTRPSFAATGAPDEDVGVDNIETLANSEMLQELKAHLATSDASNVVSTTSFGGRARQAAALTEIPSDAFVQASDRTGDSAPDSDVSEVQATRVTYSNGVVESAVSIYNHENKTMIVSRQMDKPLDGVSSIVRRLDVASDKLSTVAQSINGSVPREIGVEDVSTLSDDPCGGCGYGSGTTRERLQDVCNWELTLNCARDAGLCVACIPASIGNVVAVLLCVAGQCGWAALDSCCSSMSSACVRCARQT